MQDHNLTFRTHHTLPGSSVLLIDPVAYSAFTGLPHSLHLLSRPCRYMYHLAFQNSSMTLFKKCLRISRVSRENSVAATICPHSHLIVFTKSGNKIESGRSQLPRAAKLAVSNPTWVESKVPSLSYLSNPLLSSPVLTCKHAHSTRHTSRT